jgi:thioredoxin-related protein
MKKILLLFATIAFLVTTTAFTTEKETLTVFNGTYNDALIAAKTQNKPIFIDSYTTSCRYCKKMDRTTFRNREVVKYLNSHFITVKMNMRSDEGRVLKNKYEINALPTLLFVDAAGEPLVRVNGFIDTKTFLRKAKKAKRKFD